jgi:hypothetical protein
MDLKKSSQALGLRLSRDVLKVLRERGIFARSAVSIERQHLAQRYVVRGLESGGAVGDVGHYVTFARDDGLPAEYLCPVESIGANGLHAVVVAPSIVRIEMLRKAHTYELLITQHRPQALSERKTPSLETKILFRGIHGRLEVELAGQNKIKGTGLPTFYSKAGEAIGVPKRFRPAVRAATKAVNCAGCSHCHYVRSAKTISVDENFEELPAFKDSVAMGKAG